MDSFRLEKYEIPNRSRPVYCKLNLYEKIINGCDTDCNTFKGSYELAKENRKRFLLMATTLKAFPDLDLNESEF